MVTFDWHKLYFIEKYLSVVVMSFGINPQWNSWKGGYPKVTISFYYNEIWPFKQHFYFDLVTYFVSSFWGKKVGLDIIFGLSLLWAHRLGLGCCH